MRYPQLLVYEKDGLLAVLLRKTAKTHGWSLREPRRPESCLRLLRRQGPTVLIIKVPSSPNEEQGRKVEAGEAERIRALTLLDQVHWLFPETAVIVVGDTDDPPLAGLAWDLGASYVLFPPQPRQQLPDIVSGLMQGIIRKQPGAGGRNKEDSGKLPDQDRGREF